MKCEFTKSDFEALIDADAGLVDDKWEGFCGLLRISDKGLYLRYQPKMGEKPLVDMTLFKSGAPVLPFPFTLAQFTTFCAWHPLFKWEAIEAGFTKNFCAWSALTGRDAVEATLIRRVDVADDFPVDADALAELDARSPGAGVLVRHILEIDDNEFSRAWVQHCAINEGETKIAEISALKAMSISEIDIRDKALAELRGSLAVLKDNNHHTQESGTESAPAQSPAAPEGVVAADASAGVDLLPAGEPKRNAVTGPVFSMARTALVSRHLHNWPTIDRDLKDASTNGLSAAKAGTRDWSEAAALAWAEAKGKLKIAAKPADRLTQAIHSMGSLPSQKHRLEG